MPFGSLESVAKENTYFAAALLQETQFFLQEKI